MRKFGAETKSFISSGNSSLSNGTILTLCFDLQLVGCDCVESNSYNNKELMKLETSLRANTQIRIIIIRTTTL